ncbi:putative adaptor protein Cbl domain superfamily [Helianthus annuus]|nr:putative adaptor protein Cbl domain superfamily [Helianthus annuus]KAJ0499622.1 putative adaptor protein Cbl domain superfamily [Helianthus annuus]KAJ0665635.1 putative adaptor protein Cbl domain superfamily [Helianthus annuus]
MAEILPIGTILAVAINQVIKTAHAAKDVVIEKESFRTLSAHLFDIVSVLKQLELGELNESPITRKALENLETDVKKANTLVEKYKNRGRFYLLIKCRHIVKEVQDVTRDIGKSLNSLCLANAEILSGISDEVTRLQNEMQRAEFATCQSQIRILDKLDQGLASQKLDNGFANDIIVDIARAVGVTVEPSEIRKELDSFKREKEEAENRKERAEVYLLEQIIELLSRADAAQDYEHVKGQYMQRLRVIEGHDPKSESIPPFKAFICGITNNVMVDPVSLSNGTAYSRVAIEAWFGSGEKTDPITGEPLEDLSFRSNIQLRQSIQEWKELNYCMIIRSCKSKLMSRNDSSVEDAVYQIRDLIKENSINKDWISIGGLTVLLIDILPNLRNQQVKTEVFVTLKYAVEGHARNKDLLVENKGFCHIVPCLVHESTPSKAALELIYEIAVEESGQNVDYTRELSQQCNPVSFLVTILKGTEAELSEKAHKMLKELVDIDEENVVISAKEEWYEPLVDCIVQGPKSTKMAILRRIVHLELEEHNTKVLCELGLIPPLLEMASADLEAKELSLSMLVKLSTVSENKRVFSAAGGVPLIVDTMCSTPFPVVIPAKCLEILEKLSSNGDGITFLVDVNRTQLNLESLVENLLAFLQNSLLPCTVLRPVLRSLFNICESESGLVKTAVLTAGGISLVLNLLDHADSETREAAINLLFLFSNHEPLGVAEFLLKPRRLEAFIGLLENTNKSDVQKAAVGLLANLPKSEVTLTSKLIELEGLKAIIEILESGNTEAKENALSALFRFTDPTNIEAQKMVVELGAYNLLVDFLKNGSVTAKARAAALIGDLSMRSSELTMTSSTGQWCSCFGRARVNTCPAHGGICSVKSTFCLLEAKALPELVKLLHGEVHATAYEAIQTLSTLVDKESPRRGTHVLHESGAVVPILEVLNWGSESLKVEALEVLEKVFMLTEMVDRYGSTARMCLVRLTGRSIHEEGHLHRKAAKVLLLIERHSRSSTSFVTGVSG